MAEKFIKKPVTIEAVEFKGHNVEEVLEFTGTDNVAGHGTGVIHIKTLEGVMTGSVGDWIIKGLKGEFYPCKPDIFKMTYDPIW